MADISDSAVVGLLLYVALSPFLIGTGVYAVIHMYRRRKWAEKRVEEAQTSAQVAARQAWLDALVAPEKPTYRNEVEVELKFIYPLVKHLGYANNDIAVRVPVKFQLGRSWAVKEADWMLGGNAEDMDNPNAAVIIEAKHPKQSLDDPAVLAQARSYAFGTGAPVYAITNGSRLQLYKRGLESDSRVLDCESSEIPGHWRTIADLIGPGGQDSQPSHVPHTPVRIVKEKPKQPISTRQKPALAEGRTEPYEWVTRPKVRKPRRALSLLLGIIGGAVICVLVGIALLVLISGGSAP